MGWTRALHFLDASLVWLWPLGCALGVIDELTQIARSQGSSVSSVCDLQRASVRQEETFFLVICFMVSLVAYVLTLYRVQRFPGSVQILVWRMCWLYPVNFFVTYGMLLVYYIIGNEGSRGRVVFAIALSLEGLNGLINAASYALNCRFARRDLLLDANRESRQSLPVVSPAAASVSSEQRRLNNVEEQGRKAFVAFHVGFCEDIESVVRFTVVSEEPSEASTTESRALRREEAEKVLRELESQEETIMRISGKLAERRMETGKSLPAVSMVDPGSVTASDLKDLEELRAERLSWITYHQEQLS